MRERSSFDRREGEQDYEGYRRRDEQDPRAREERGEDPLRRTTSRARPFDEVDRGQYDRTAYGPTGQGGTGYGGPYGRDPQRQGGEVWQGDPDDPRGMRGSVPDPLDERVHPRDRTGYPQSEPRRRPFDDLEEWQRPWQQQAQGNPGYGGGSYGPRGPQGPGWGGDPGRYGGGAQGEPQRGPYSGRGPKDYQRSDDRIREDVCERLTEHPDVDASEVSVQVSSGEVTLQGSVSERRMKRLAEDCAESVSGVHEVHNQIRVRTAG